MGGTRRPLITRERHRLHLQECARSLRLFVEEEGLVETRVEELR